MSERFDAYQAVTDTIIAALEKGVVPWRQPWTQAGNLPLSLSSKKPYRGVNVLLLALVGASYPSPYWGTYNKIAELGGQVRKGEKSTMVTFWRQILIKDTDENGKPVKKRIPMLRVYRVFNVEQADWPEGSKKPDPPVKPELVEHDPIAAAEAIVAGYPNPPVITRMLSDRAFYMPSTDVITVPELSQYQDAGEFYSTLFHEIGHSTGHKSRLARPDLASFSHFGDEKYSKEELVAELTSAFLSAHTGIEATLDNSAAYIEHWLGVLRGDHKLVVQAAAQAQKAADHVLGVVYAEPDEAAEKELVSAS